MNGNNDHGNNIDENISALCKRVGHDFKDRLIFMIRKMEIEKVKNNKKQHQKAGVGHG